MSGFAYVVRSGKAEKVALKEALGRKADLAWTHLTVTDEHAKEWLGGEAKLSPYVIEALTAAETRPRCDAVGPGAVINLRGLSSEEMAASDPLASIRIYALEGRVFSVTRKQLNAIPTVEAEIGKGAILDPGDLIAALAQAITEELDPVVADLGDSLDDCEERIAANRAFELRRLVNQARVQAIGYRRFLEPQRAA
ncbi:MAG: zinc transporter ZntB, partial [Sphingomonadales bacterium]